MGVLTRIYLRPSARTPVRRVSEATAVPGTGLLGDHAGGGARQVTLMAEEAWEAACADAGRPDLDPGGRRANLIVRGLRLSETIGQVIAIGPCEILVRAEMRPCRLMDDVAAGLQRALEPACRGGVYGRVLAGGEIETGMEARVRPAPVEPRQAALPLEAK